MEYHLRLSRTVGGWLIFMIFFLPAIITGFISYYSSNRIDNEIYHIEPEEEEILEDRKKTSRLADRKGTIMGLKILALIISVFVLAAFIEMLIYIDPTTP